MAYKKQVAKFEKVTYEQFKKDFIDCKLISLNEGMPEAVCRLMYNNIRLPKRATKGSAGYDFFTPIKIKLNPKETIKIPTGIRCSMNNNVVLCLFPRSGLGFKYRLQLNNTVGIIDSDYYNADNEGHIMAKITNDSNEEKILEIDKDDAFMQGIFFNYLLAEEEEVNTERRGGFGSTSKK